MKRKALAVSVAGLFMMGSAAMAQDVTIEQAAANVEAQGYTDVMILDDDPSDGVYLFEAFGPDGNVLLIEVNAETGEIVEVPTDANGEGDDPEEGEN